MTESLVVYFCETYQLFLSLSVRNGSPFAQKMFASEPVRPECRSPRVRSPTGLEGTGSVRPYSMAYHRSCVMLKIPTVHSLKSVKFPRQYSKINEQIEKIKTKQNSYE